MKRQIRRCVFETNSSSTHSITMCLKSDYDKWQNGDMFLYKGSGWSYPDGNKPKMNHFYTREEAIEFQKLDKYCPENVNWDNKDEVDEILKENEFYDSDFENDYLEWYEESFTTPSGETVVAFGEYGYEG